MTDLSKGIIDFGDVVVTPDTTKKELIGLFGEKLSKISTDTDIKFVRPFCVCENQFSVWFYFNKLYQLSSIKLSPYIDYKSENWDRTGQQEERREFCDKWLYEQLGEPQRNLGGAEYIFDGLRISTVTHFDQHNGADAGYIVITYLR